MYSDEKIRTNFLEVEVIAMRRGFDDDEELDDREYFEDDFDKASEDDFDKAYDEKSGRDRTEEPEITIQGNRPVRDTSERNKNKGVYRANSTPRERAMAAANAVKAQREREKRKKKKRRRQLLTVYLIAFTMIFLTAVGGAYLIKKLSPVEDTGGSQIYAGTDRNLSENPELTHTESSSGAEGNASTAATTEKDYVDDAYNGIKDLNSDFWYNAELYTDEEKKDDVYFAGVCFIGDSRTKGLLVFSDLPSYHGFYEEGFTAKRACEEKAFTVRGKDGYYNVLKAIELCDDSVFYLGFGVNDMYGDVDSYLKYYKKIMDKIYECHPDAIVYVESILPVSQKYEAKNPGFSNAKAQQFNQALKELCREDGRLIYLDVASVCYDEEGAANVDMVSDGIHYNRSGYAIIREYIKEHVVSKIRE